MLSSPFYRAFKKWNSIIVLYNYLLATFMNMFKLRNSNNVRFYKKKQTSFEEFIYFLIGDEVLKLNNVIYQLHIYIHTRIFFEIKSAGLICNNSFTQKLSASSDKPIPEILRVRNMQMICILKKQRTVWNTYTTLQDSRFKN